MGSAHQYVTYLMWIASCVGQLAACGFMLRRGGSRQFPRFFAYTLFGVLQNPILFWFHQQGDYARYFYAFWVSCALSALLGLAVIQEVFYAALKPFAGLRDLGRIAFRWSAALLLLIAMLVGFDSHQNVLMASVQHLEGGVRMMEVGLLLLLFTASEKIGLSMRSRVFGVALGIGFTAASNLLFASMWPKAGSSLLLVLNLTRVCSFLAACVIWNLYFALPAVKEQPVLLPVTSPLMRWNEAALAFGHSGGRVMYTSEPESFLPSVERMVDRVLDRDLA
jgi:hypothetical protein